MPFVLDDLINDERLELLFSEGHECAFQAWIMESEKDGIRETKLLYARLLPYNFSNNYLKIRKIKSIKIDGYQITISKLELYLDSTVCKTFLSLISDGKSLHEIQHKLNLQLDEQVKDNYKDFKFFNLPILFCPTIFLMNRSSFTLHELKSPCDVSAFGASLCISDKKLLFLLDDQINSSLIKEAIKILNKETGLKFDKDDMKRFGILELLVFPALDKNEMNLLHSSVKKNSEVRIDFISSSLPQFKKFQFHINLINGGNTILSTIVVAEEDKNGHFNYLYKLDPKLSGIIDEYRIDVYAIHPKRAESILCCSSQYSLVRELNLNMIIHSPYKYNVKFDWLQNSVPKKLGSRANKALIPTTASHNSESIIGGRNEDPWVKINEDFLSMMKIAVPEKSESRFFPRYSESKGKGRLAFVEWMKALFDTYKSHNITIIDPYFESIGLSLLQIASSSKSNYIILRNAPENNEQRNRLDETIGQLDLHKELSRNLNIKLYTITKNYLHDRYILINDNSGLPIKGFHLSNSFQHISDKYPLLVTTIPADVLFTINEYVFTLIKRVSGNKTKLLFDSQTLQEQSTDNENDTKFNFLNINGASELLDDKSLLSLKGEMLVAKLTELNVINNSNFRIPKDIEFLKCINNISDVVNKWEVLGEFMARTIDYCDFSTKKEIVTKGLIRFLENSAKRDIKSQFNTQYLSKDYLEKGINDLLFSSDRIDYFVLTSKYNALTWGDFFAIKYLWKNDQACFLTLLNDFIENNKGSYSPLILSIIGQMLSEIALSIVLINEITNDSIQILLSSKNGLLNWFAWNKLLFFFEDRNLNFLPFEQQLQFLSWGIKKSARNIFNEYDDSKKLYKKLINAFGNILPETLTSDEISIIIDSLKGHMKTLNYLEEEIFADIIENQLMKKGNIDYVAEIWEEEFFREFTNYGVKVSLSKEQIKLMRQTAYLFIHSSLEYQKKLISEFNNRLRNNRNIIQQPLASSINYAKWDLAVDISLSILAVTKLIQKNLKSEYGKHECREIDSLLTDIVKESTDLGMRRAENGYSNSEKNIYDLLDEIN